jgi:hypothetical protein
MRMGRSREISAQPPPDGSGFAEGPNKSVGPSFLTDPGILPPYL